MEPEWNRSIIDEGKGAMEIEWEPESLDPGNVKPPLPFPAGEPNNQGTAVVPPTNRPPNDDTIGDLTSELRNFHIVQCPEEKGIVGFNFIYLFVPGLETYVCFLVCFFLDPYLMNLVPRVSST